MTTTIARELDREWARLTASAPAGEALARWRTECAELAGVEDLDGVLARRTDPDAAPAVLAALARWAPGDAVAARTLLQALLPGLVRLAATTGYDDPVALDELVSLAWERIRTYPPSRRGSVPANVLWDVRKRYRRHREVEAPRSTALDPGDRHLEHEPSAEAVVLGRLGYRQVVERLAAAQRDGVISTRSLRLVVRTRLAGDPLDEVASEERVNVHALTQRRWRAEQRLRALLLVG